MRSLMKTAILSSSPFSLSFQQHWQTIQSQELMAGADML